MIRYISDAKERVLFNNDVSVHIVQSFKTIMTLFLLSVMIKSINKTAV